MFFLPGAAMQSMCAGYDMSLWGTKCPGQRYSAIGLMEGRGPQLSPHTMVVRLQAETETRTMGLVFLHFAPLSETPLDSLQALKLTLKSQMGYLSTLWWLACYRATHKLHFSICLNTQIFLR